MAGNNLQLNNPGYIQAIAQSAIKDAQQHQQRQALAQTINNYIANLNSEQNNHAICLLRWVSTMNRCSTSSLQEGFNGLRDLQNVTLDDLTEMATRISRKPSTKGPVNIGMIILKRIEALAFWVKNRIICGEALSSNDFMQAVPDEVQANMTAS